MKDIKFRALDKEKKVFVKGMLCFGYDDFKWVLLNDNYEQILWSYNGELQQYTGLKDKNGVEIYEGDILRTKNKKVQEVIFMNGFFQMPEFFIDETDEVIGNIYENKELLEGF